MLNEIQLELSSYCNARCTMCLKKEDTRKQGNMGFNLAKRIIDESGVKNLKASWFGEPLLNPEFKKIIKYAYDQKIRIFLFTNGSLIDKEMAEFLLKYTDRVFISIDDIDKEYENIRVGLRYKDVDRAIKLLIDHDIILTAVYQNDEQIKRLKERYPEFKINIAKYVDRYKRNINRNEITCLHNVDGRLVVAWDGKCYLCCEDWLGKHFIGDLNEQTIDEIWNGELRKNYLDNLDKLEICQNCTA